MKCVFFTDLMRNKWSVLEVLGQFAITSNDIYEMLYRLLSLAFEEVVGRKKIVIAV